MKTPQPTTAALPAPGIGRLQPYRGDFLAWQGGCVFLSEGGGSPIAPHSHYAIQLAIGAPTGLRVQIGRRGVWEQCAAALVPSRATHTIDVSECTGTAVIFVEPETAEGRALGKRLAGKLELLDESCVAVHMKRLLDAWQVQCSAADVEAACRSMIQDLSQTAVHAPSDARVLAAIELIRQRLVEAPSLEEVAREMHLSPSRFRHLFVQETGMPMRTYVLWRRLLHVWSVLVQGESLSDAAHAAGFADSAHLSRTARAMFGLPPSALQVGGPLSRRARSRN